MSWLNQDPVLEEVDESVVEQTLWQLFRALCGRIYRFGDAHLRG